MSHFALLVVLPADSAYNRATVETILDVILAPFNEQPDNAPERLEDCYCVDHKLTKAAEAEAEAQFGSFMDLRNAHMAQPKVEALVAALRTSQDADERERIDEELDAIWQAHIAPRVAAEEAFKEANRVLLGGPNPECNECSGTGWRTTTRPADRHDEAGALIGGPKWDWWVIGGRWTGLLDGYDPTKDPANLERCFLCAGSGKRTRHDAEHVDTIDCNGCKGTGQRVAWSLQPHEGDVGRVQQVLDDVKKAPFAILTPDGRWCERGLMGWFGMAHNKKSRGKWREQVIAILTPYADHVCVIVDCHI